MGRLKPACGIVQEPSLWSAERTPPQRAFVDEEGNLCRRERLRDKISLNLIEAGVPQKADPCLDLNAFCDVWKSQLARR
jgi:hypothetical protein